MQGTTHIATRPVMPARRLSVSSNSQWVAASGYPLSSSASSSGYALSPNTGGATLPNSSNDPGASPSASSIHRSPSFKRNIRQLDPVSIFERLGLGGPSSTTQLTTSQANPTAGPSPGREDAHLPSEEFEGINDDHIQDTSDMMTPMPSSSSNTGPSRRTLSNSASMMEDNTSISSSSTGLAILQAQANSKDDNETLLSSSSSSSTNPRTPSQTLLEIASAPPVDLVDPSIHPPHALVFNFATAEQSSSNNGQSEDDSSNKKIIPINEDILLPFVDRPTEVRELLELENRNRSLFERLKEVFDPHLPSSSSSPSSSSTTTTSQLPASTTTSSSSSTDNNNNNHHHHKHTWQEVESILYKSREELKDQEWIDSLKSLIFPRSTALWERLRACLGIDVDDEQGGDKFEELSSDFNLSILSPSNTNASNNQQQQHGSGFGIPPSPSSTSSDVFSLPGSQQKLPPAAPSSLADDMLSPRAVLRTQVGGGGGAAAVGGIHQQQQYQGNTAAGAINIPGLSPSLNNNNSRLNIYSPTGSTGVSPCQSPGPGNSSISAAASRHFDRTISSSSNTAGTGDSGSNNRSPNRSTHSNLNNSSNNTGDPSSSSASSSPSSSARMHRRTSSGGSSFRRSFAMSSISEDAPVVDFGTSNSGPSTPSLEVPSNYGAGHSSIGNPSPSLPMGGGTNTTTSGDYGMPNMSSNAINIGGTHHNHHPQLQGSALSTSSSSSVISGHSMMHGQANLLSPSNSSHSLSNNNNNNNGISSLGLNVDATQIQNSPQISRSPSFSNSSRFNMMGSSSLGNSLGGSSGNFPSSSSSSSQQSIISSSPSFNTLYNKRAYDEYNSVFESDDGDSVSGSVRSTGRGPGMRRSFGQLEALSPIRGSTPRQSGTGSIGSRNGGGGGGFALAGLNIGGGNKGSTSSSSQNSTRNTTPKP